MYMYDIYIYIYIYTRNTKNSSTYFSPSGAINVLCAGFGRGGSRVIPRWYTGFLAEELPHRPQPRRHRYHHPHQHHHHPCEHAPPKDHPNEAPSTASVPPVPPTAPAVSAAPVRPTAPAPPTASVALAPPTASVPLAPAPVRMSYEWVTQLGVVVSRSYQPP